MRVAQRLYEAGYITYMRTDSTTLSESALAAARKQVRELFGDDFVPEQPRNYGRAVANAQEAHEAIRPAGDTFRTPDEVKGEVGRDEHALYDLVWKRTLASQMEDARGQTVSLRIGATSANGEDVEFAASGTVITFRGFLAAYEPGRDEPSEDDEERRLPQLTVGQEVDLASLEPEGHSTSPPPRYTEPTLVKAMEDRGIGRPSTYAAILSTIVDRGYVFKKGTALVPTFLAFAVVNLLERHFEQLVDFDFTARMEDDLDRIASGDEDRVAWLARFYFGEGDDGRGLRHLVTEHLDEIDARAVNSIAIPGSEAVVRVGRYGPYLERGEQRASLPADLAPDELTAEKAEEILGQPDSRPLGVDPESGHELVVRVRTLRPLRHGGAPGGRGREAAHRLALRLYVTGDRDAGGRAAAADPAAGRRRDRRRGGHGAERPIRAVREEGQRLALARERGAALHRHARGGQGATRTAAAPARPRPGARPAPGARRGSRDGKEDRRPRRPLRPLRDRRGDEREPAPGRHRGGRHARAGGRIAGRETR